LDGDLVAMIERLSSWAQNDRAIEDFFEVDIEELGGPAESDGRANQNPSLSGR
jgi:hypothetical protein